MIVDAILHRNQRQSADAASFRSFGSREESSRIGLALARSRSIPETLTQAQPM